VLSQACCCAQVGAEIVRKALSYPLRLIANNAGVNGSVVQQRVLENLDRGFGYNAATDKYEDLMQAGIIDPTKVRPLPEEDAQTSTRVYVSAHIPLDKGGRARLSQAFLNPHCAATFFAWSSREGSTLTPSGQHGSICCNC
jgi:hypothetical protein